MGKLALLFFTLFVGGVLAAFLVTPVASVLVYKMVYMVNPDSRWWAASIPGLRYSLIASLTMLFVLGVRYKELSALAPWKEQPVFKWILALLITYLLMINIAIVPALHKQFTIEFVKLIVIIFVAYKLINTEKALDACLWAYILGATYIGYVAHSTGRDGQGRVEGIGMIDTGGDSNGTAAALIPALVLLIHKAWLGNKKVKVAAVICGALIANGVVLINSRGAFLGAVCGGLFFVFYMLFSKYQRKGQRGSAILIILLGIGGALYVADDAFWERMGTLKEVEDGDASGSHRIDFWLATFDMMADNPLGVGINGFVQLSPSYLPDHYFDGRTSGKAVHSTWFQVLSEVGWVGFFILIAMLISTMKQSSRAKIYLLERQNFDAYFKLLSLEGAFYSYLVAASFIDRGRAVTLYWLILLILVAANIYFLRYRRAVRY
ncbi:O-antigen ligase family protein [Marinobacter xiaoshiensis]|uniref:O-antigen ligase family protein n=1 Tax=Marinobacter xiaoshiensis TaxID=3073652 RepID=A0ABU2HFV3_9GAMM|nr:O-antigen ligase family protein [Marinobacter sp. F60267]MDS1309927.1 O-antigen ligase family protein [Marinobacter sp. F60267]